MDCTKVADNGFFELDNILTKLGFIKSKWTNCVYFKKDIILLVYVDDIIIFGKTKGEIDNLIESLKENFDLKILGKTRKLLGIEFLEIDNKLFIHQKSYIEKICKRYDSYKCNFSSLPIAKGTILSKLDCPKTSEEANEIATFPYRSLLGSLAFISSRTRPDITYTVNLLSQFQSEPGIKHWDSLLKLLGYLRSTQDYMLDISKVENLNLRCFSDSDYAANRDDRVSIGGFIIFLDKVPISWRTSKQKSVSLSTMEAEYISMTEAAKELIWLKNVLEDNNLNLNLNDCKLYGDNQSAISFSRSPVENQRTKHISVRYHFLRNLVYDKTLKLGYISSRDNLADIFTKALTKEQLRKFCTEIFEM